MRLKDLGIHLPLIPTTSVGSFPKPDNLKKARAQFAKGKLSREDLTKIEKECTLFWLKKQEELGIDVSVDGEQYRGDMVEYFAENIEGFEISGFVRSYGNRYYTKPIIKKALRWSEPITVSHWEFAQKNTKLPVKGMLTGPYTIMDWSYLEHYGSRKEATFALAQIVRKEVEALIKAGCKIIQIDEPAISTRFDEVSWACDALGECTKGLNAYFLTHMCYGEFSKIYDRILNIPVDNLDIEMSNSNLGLMQQFKEKKFKKDVSFGIVDVHSHKIEDSELAKNRLREAIQVLGKDQVWADPDCGLKTRSVEEAIDKLKVVVEATKAVRKELK